MNTPSPARHMPENEKTSAKKAEANEREAVQNPSYCGTQKALCFAVIIIV